MKRIWRNKEGVSPVIATILMVAITVVLAAVLYVMVSGYMTGGSGTPAAGSLTKDTTSTVSTGNATLTLQVSTPAQPATDTITVKVFDDQDNDVTADFTITWVHYASNTGDNFYKTGDKVKLVNDVYGTDISGFKVSVTFENYSGVVEKIL